jgi:hypothetical protein
MFAYRFFIAAHSLVGSAALVRDQAYFRPLLTLYQEWVSFRDRRDEPIYARLDDGQGLTPAAIRWEGACARRSDAQDGGESQDGEFAAST